MIKKSRPAATHHKKLIEQEINLNFYYE